MRQQQTLGRFGEEKAAEYLKKNGYTVIQKNFRCRTGEIDIIARNSRYICFVEVKLRKNKEFGEAREFVTYSKQRKVISAAKYYLAFHDQGLQPRFDVIEIYAPDGEDGNITVNCIEDAFR